MNLSTLEKFLLSFLFWFMICIFGPAEVFFANVAEFPWLYAEFAVGLAACAFVGTIISGIILCVSKGRMAKVLVSILLGIVLAGYIQVMFLNRNLDLMGVTPEGYILQLPGAIINSVIWLFCIAAVIFLALKYEKIWKKGIIYVSVFLFLIQIIAFAALFVTAKEEAFRRKEGDLYLSGADQYTVSANKNIIVFILDYFGSGYMDSIQEQYPEAMDCLHDFTYYSNMDCVYFGTFPSIAHMVTGEDVDTSILINEWFKKSWESEEVRDFYGEMKEKGFVVNYYTGTGGTNYLCGGMGQDNLKLLEGKMSNLADTPQEVVINISMICRAMFQISAFRFAPDVLKSCFYIRESEYIDAVIVKENHINYENFDFYSGLKGNGLHADRKSNYFIIQHLVGMHEFTTDGFGNYKEESSAPENAMGCMTMVGAYLKQMKELGVYEDATIIVTADHGSDRKPQVIFYIKQPGETHEVSPINDAPVSFCEFLPTIATAAGLDGNKYGNTIWDFVSGEERERFTWVRTFDDDYPSVPCMTEDRIGETNVYQVYKYTGNAEDLNQLIEEKEYDSVVRMKDCFY